MSNKISLFRKWNLLCIFAFSLSIFSMLPAFFILSLILNFSGIMLCSKSGKKGKGFCIAGLILSLPGLAATLSPGTQIVATDLMSHIILLLLAAALFGVIVMFMALFNAMINSSGQAQKTYVPTPKASETSKPSAPMPLIRIRSMKNEDGKLIYRSYTNHMKKEDDFDSEAADIPYDIVVSRSLAEFICSLGFEFLDVSIGGGVNEISHTGDVAYSAFFTDLEQFGTCYEHYRNAQREASSEYGSWFSSLNYNYIIMRFKKPGCSLRVDYGYELELCFSFDESFNESDSLCAIHKFLFSQDQALCADRLWHDKSAHLLRQTIQLDSEHRYFLSIFADERGLITKKVLDVEDANDSHYEFNAEAEEKLLVALQNELDSAQQDIDYLLCRYIIIKGGHALEALAARLCSAQFHF